MEITININLEDADIALLIKSLFEIIKRLPQDNAKVNINPVPQNVKIYPYSDGNEYNTAVDPNVVEQSITSDPNIDAPIYKSTNGETIQKIDEEKKNENF